MIKHARSGLLCDPESGVVYKKRGGRFKEVTRDGYRRASWGENGKVKNCGEHRVIYEAVHGPIPAGMQVNHINGIKDDNRISNLELNTPQQNTFHAHATGLVKSLGENHRQAKMTTEDVRQIRNTVGTVSIAEWARSLGVHKRTVSDARNYRRWRFIATDENQEESK